jgi:excisionase family DNA binding protein
MPGLTCSVTETAKLLGVSRSQVYVLLGQGVLPKVPNLGRVCRIPRRAVEQLVESSMEASA